MHVLQRQVRSVTRLSDHGAERRLLGSIMRRPDLWAEIAMDFKPEMFDAPLHREIAEAAKKHARPGGRFPLSQVLRELRGMDKHVAGDLANMADEVITTAEVESLVEMLSDL